MTTKLIIAALVLGSSSLAMAAPVAQVTVTANARGTTTVVRDHREPERQVISHPIIIAQPARPVISHPIIVERPIYSHPVISHPIIIERPVITHPVISHPIIVVRPTVTLAADQQLVNGRTEIGVGGEADRFATLTLAADGGRTYVEKVVVKFADGKRQVIDHLDRTLVGNASLTVDLDGNRREIQSVAVFGNELDNGFRYERGAFTVTAS
ncbi:MAG TPA: hypothetical protein VH165_21235 [Kofleriaceae bacterium]|nr:hypothetical protein [Kofleriaceae bacterium]